MDYKTLVNLDQTYIANTYARNPIAIKEGKNANITDITGENLIDFSSGVGVISAGHANPYWVEAVKNQLDKLAHCSNLYYTQPAAALAEKLCARTGMKKVFFANSGAEANECAIKTARKYMSDYYGGKRDTIVTLRNSFHGRTIATLAATGQEKMHKHFTPFPEGFDYAQPNDISDLLGKISGNVGAVLIELIQGEGGVVELTGEFVDKIKEICDKRDILLMVDEIQTGAGRTGKFLCCEHYGIKPDIITLAKGLGGGLPIGAALFGEKTRNILTPGDHGSTFGGNPVCCAGAGAVLDIIDDKFLDEVTKKGEYLKQKLLDIPGIESVSGKGLMLGAKLRDGLSNTQMVAECIKKGVVLLTAKEKLRFLPPLTIDYPDIDKGTQILRSVFA